MKRKESKNKNSISIVTVCIYIYIYPQCNVSSILTDVQPVQQPDPNTPQLYRFLHDDKYERMQADMTMHFK